MSTNYLYRNIVSSNVSIPSGGGVPVIPPKLPPVSEISYITSTVTDIITDDRFIYIGSNSTNTLEVYDTTTGALVNNFSGKSVYRMLSVGNYIYYIDQTTTLKKVNKDTGVTEATIDFGSDSLQGISLYSPTEIFVTAFSTDSFYILDTADDTFTTTAYTTPPFNGVRLNASKKGGLTYPLILYTQGSDTFYAFDEDGSNRQGLTSSPNDPIFITQDDTFAYLQRSNNDVTSINFDTGVFTPFLDTVNSYGLGYTSNKVFISSLLNDVVKVFDYDTKVFIEDISINNPWHIASDKYHDGVWVSMNSDGKVVFYS